MGSKAVVEKLWREACLYRARFCCEICGKTSPQVHHIVLRSQARNNPKVLWDFHNGIVLCETCHSEAHASHQWLMDRLPGRLLPGQRDRLEAILRLQAEAKIVCLGRPGWKKIKETLCKQRNEARELHDMTLDCESQPGNWRQS